MIIWLYTYFHSNYVQYTYKANMHTYSFKYTYIMYILLVLRFLLPIFNVEIYLIQVCDDVLFDYNITVRLGICIE